MRKKRKRWKKPTEEAKKEGDERIGKGGGDIT